MRTAFFLLLLTLSLQAVEPSGVITRKYVYGPMNRIKAIIEADQKITQFLYNKCGQLQTKIKPDGTELHREYDALGRLSRYYSTDFDYHYTYDKKDRLLSVHDTISNQSTIRTYNIYSNIIQETLGTDLTFCSDFDPYDKRQALKLPDGSDIHFTYHAYYLHSVSRNHYTSSYERDLSGHITKIELPANLGAVNIERDPCSRWKKVSSPYFSADYSDYDPNGNLCEYTYQDSLGSVTCSYEYDALDQLIAENDHTYVYDSLYNRRKKDLSLYAVNDLCQVLDDGNQVYQYDGNGNLISDGVHQFAYDTQDRLIEIQKGDLRVVYTYDPFHRRLSKQVFRKIREMDTKLYLWDGDNEIGACDKKGRVQELRILGDGLGAEIGAAVLFEFKGKTYVPIHDHRGCVVTLVDANKEKPVEIYRYSAYGEELTNGTLSPWRFASKRIDEETGLIFFGRRYYCPQLGRWMTPDPQGFDNGSNLYAYLKNSPLTDFDLYGLWSMREAWGNAQHFMWGMLEGSGYHFHNMASSFGMRDFSSTDTWQPRSLLSSNQDLAVSARGMDWAERSVLPFTYEARRLGSDVSQLDTMRARGRAFGEQAITLGGLLSAWNVGKNVLNSGARFQNATRLPVPQELSREYLFSGKVKTPQNVNSGRNKNWLQPNTQAEGAHSVFRRDPVTGRVTHYETFRPQTNSYDPKPWESILRFDNPIEPHYHFNKTLKERIYTPHVHDPYSPGGIRPAFPEELPWGGR